MAAFVAALESGPLGHTDTACDDEQGQSTRDDCLGEEVARAATLGDALRDEADALVADGFDEQDAFEILRLLGAPCSAPSEPEASTLPLPRWVSGPRSGADQVSTGVPAVGLRDASPGAAVFFAAAVPCECAEPALAEPAVTPPSAPLRVGAGLSPMAESVHTEIVDGSDCLELLELESVSSSQIPDSVAERHLPHDPGADLPGRSDDADRGAGVGLPAPSEIATGTAIGPTSPGPAAAPLRAGVGPPALAEMAAESASESRSSGAAAAALHTEILPDLSNCSRLACVAFLSACENEKIPSSEQQGGVHCGGCRALPDAGAEASLAPSPAPPGAAPPAALSGSEAVAASASSMVATVFESSLSETPHSHHPVAHPAACAGGDEIKPRWADMEEDPCPGEPDALRVAAEQASAEVSLLQQRLADAREETRNQIRGDIPGISDAEVEIIASSQRAAFEAQMEAASMKACKGKKSSVSRQERRQVYQRELRCREHAQRLFVAIKQRHER